MNLPIALARILWVTAAVAVLPIEGRSGQLGRMSSIEPCGTDASIHAGLQRLDGRITAEGLWIVSSAEDDPGPAVPFQIRATAQGRRSGPEIRLETQGEVRASSDCAAWLRPGLIEEFRATLDGIRQDFVIPARPPGEGEFVVRLELAGARAVPEAGRAKLILDGSGREIAYHRLRVTGADGQELAAELNVLNDATLEIRVEDRNAVYPIRIDPTFSDEDWISLDGAGNTVTQPGASSHVRAATFDRFGNLYIGGDFSKVGGVNANRIARWNGNTWNAVGGGIYGTVHALAADPAGDIYAGGSFPYADTTPAANIAKWNGTSWSPVGTGINGVVMTLKADELGNVYAGGDFSQAGGKEARNVAVWNGTAWQPLGQGTSYASLNSGDTGWVVLSLALDRSGNLYAGGTFTKAGTVNASKVAKWNGSSWSALGSGFPTTQDQFRPVKVSALAIDSAGKLYAAGDFTMSAGGTTVNCIASWNGTTWSALQTGTDGPVSALHADGSGGLYVAGEFAVAGGRPCRGLARWHDATRTWSALGRGMNGSVWALALDANGNLFAGGDFTSAGGTIATRIAKWSGGAWAPLGPSIPHRVAALALDRSGNLYAGGEFTRLGGVETKNVAKWNGSSWSALGTGVDAPVRALAADATGQLYAAGDFTSADGFPANHVARWGQSGWSPLGSGANGNVHALAIDGDGELIAAGAFTTADGAAANRIARWNGSGWSPLGQGLNDTVSALTIDGSGKLYAGGEFTTADGVSANRVAKWDGTNWSALGSGMNDTVTALTSDASGALYAGGWFTGAGGNPASHLAKWNGTSWSALGSGTDYGVLSLNFSPVGGLCIGGWFRKAGDRPIAYLARWDGIKWDAFGGGPDSGILALAADEAGDLYSGASFIQPWRNARHIAKLRFTPKVALSRSGSPISHGNYLPAAWNGTDFGLKLLTGESATHTFSITNTGFGNLTVGSAVVSGSHPDDFTVTRQPASGLGLDQSTTFDLTFDPRGPGKRSAVIRFSTGDPLRNPFEFNVQGTGTVLSNLTVDPPLDGRFGIDLSVDIQPGGMDVTRVEYYDSLRLIGVATGPDFRLQWTPDYGGQFEFRAVAYDDEGTAVESRTKVIYINSGPQPITAGTFSGLIQDDAPFGRASGHLVLTASANRSCSASLLFGSKTYRGRGTFRTDGTLQMSLISAGIPDLNLQIIAGQDYLWGRITDGIFAGPKVSGQSFLQTFTLQRYVWNARRNPATQFAGDYTGIIDIPNPSQTQMEPPGRGWASVKAGPDGKVTCTAILADGEPFTMATFVNGDSATLEWHVYRLLYGGSGLISGTVGFRDGQSGFGRFQWTRPPGTPPAKYPDGFAIVPDLNLYRYQKPLYPMVPLSLQHKGGNMVGTWTDASLADSPLERFVTMDAGGRINIPLQGPDQLSMVISSLTGRVSGKFFHPVTGMQTGFSGVLVQEMDQALGSYSTPDLDGSWTLGASLTPEVEPRTSLGSLPLPSLNILSPKNHSVVLPADGVIKVSGSARDNRGVDSVWFQILHGNTLSSPEAATGSTSWSFNVPVPAGEGGRYTVIVKAVDGDGNESLLATQTFFSRLVTPLTVNASGLGDVSRWFLGTTVRQVGGIVTIQATPTRGMRFTGWTGGITSPYRTISFPVQPDMRLEAHFAP
jgi:hypothetical protein